MTYKEFITLRKQVEALTKEFEEKAEQLAIIASGEPPPGSANTCDVWLDEEEIKFQWEEVFRGERNTVGKRIKFPSSWMDRPLDEVKIEARKLIDAQAKAEEEAKAKREAENKAEKEVWERATYERLRQKFMKGQNENI